jgi:putative NADPH-quinone reductase
MEADMSKTLVLMFHPDFANSKANAAIADAAWDVETVELVDIAAAYPARTFGMMEEGALEAQRLLTADRIVLQFPMQWYSVPGLLKDWLDGVLTRMYYVFGEEGAKLAGTPIMLAVTTGAVPDMFSAEGQAGFTLDEIFTPLKATAHRCGLPWHEPFLLHNANQLTGEALAKAVPAYQAALRRFIAATPADRVAQAA